jgi:hypothetical protein
MRVRRRETPVFVTSEKRPAIDFSTVIRAILGQIPRVPLPILSLQERVYIAEQPPLSAFKSSVELLSFH